MSNDKRHPRVKEAFQLDGDEQAIKEFYADWAENYDKDTSGIHYSACQSTYDLFTRLPDSEYLTVDVNDKSIRIMDIGCGTGLMGKKLADHGYSNVDGCDISLEMVQQADKLDIYNELTADIDINQPINPDWRDRYDVSMSVGVFTPGHVDPEALNQLIDMTRSGGLILVSTRLAYYDSTNYQQVSDQLEKDNKIKLLNVDKDRPYTDDSPAHYWAYVVLS